MTEITDGVLINNLYRILCSPEFGWNKFREIFEKIGILSEVENGEIKREQIRRIKEWIERNKGSNKDEIKFIKYLEKFRELSKSEENFNEQLEVTKNVIEYLLKLFFPQHRRHHLLLLLTHAWKLLWKYLKKTQEYALKRAEFGDHIIGCYILYNYIMRREINN